jgi:hypothetical protein
LDDEKRSAIRTGPARPGDWSSTINNRQCESKKKLFDHIIQTVHIPKNMQDRLGVILAPFGLPVVVFGPSDDRSKQRAPGQGNAGCGTNILPNPQV